MGADLREDGSTDGQADSSPGNVTPAGSEQSIRVVIVDHHAVFLAGLKLLLGREHGIESVGEARSAGEAISRVREHLPDVVLIDVQLPGASDAPAIPKLLETSPQTKVIALSMLDDPRQVRAAFRAGARGYVLKEAPASEVATAIERVHAGGNYVNPDLGARLVQAEVHERAQAEADPLSKREHDVLRLLALGYTNQEVATTLYISVRTAETHRAHIIQKLGLDSRADLVRHALRHGLIGGE